MEINDTSPNVHKEKPTLQEFELTARPENISAILEMGPSLASLLGKPVTFKFEGGHYLDGGWSRLVRPEDTPPGPVELIGGRAIDPETGETSFVVSALRFNMDGVQSFDVSGRDVADVYMKAASGNQVALNAVEALRIRNEESFNRNLRSMRNASGQNEIATSPKALEI